MRRMLGHLDGPSWPFTDRDPRTVETSSQGAESAYGATGSRRGIGPLGTAARLVLGG